MGGCRGDLEASSGRMAGKKRGRRKGPGGGAKGFFCCLALVSLTVGCAGQRPSTGDQSGKGLINPLQMEEFCRNFTQGNVREQEFYSPGHPSLYPANIRCDRILSAPPGYFVQARAQNQR